MFFKKVDLISPPTGLFFRGGSHTSIFAGILTLLSYALICFFAMRYILEFVNRKKPSAYYVNRYIEDAGIYNFNSTSFFHYIYLTEKKNKDNIQFDFDSFRIIGFNSKTYSTFLIQNPPSYEKFEHWIYGLCNTETDGKDIEEIIKLSDLSKAACLRKYYNPETKIYYDINNPKFKAPKLEHGMANENYTFYGIIVERCKDDNLRKLAGYGQCKDKNSINELISSSIINIDILDHYPDVLNYNNPFQKYFYTINSMLYEKNFISNDLTFDPALIKTNYGIVFDNSRTQYTYVFEENVRIINNEAFELYDSDGKKIYGENGTVLTKSSGFVSSFTLYEK